MFSSSSSQWKTRLMNDFYYSEESAMRLSKKFNNNYQQAYDHCDYYQTNSYQQMAITQLATSGLKREHLCGRDWFDSYRHTNALVSLITRDGLTPVQAMAELDHLNDDQAYTLSELYSKGLRSEYFHDTAMLLYYDFQLERLLYLMRDRPEGVFNIDIAMAIMSHMTAQMAEHSSFDSPQRYLDSQQAINNSLSMTMEKAIREYNGSITQTVEAPDTQPRSP